MELKSRSVLGLSPKISVVGGLPFHDVSFQDTIEIIDIMVTRRDPSYIVTANLDFLVAASISNEHHRILYNADLVVADGMPVLWLARLLGCGLQ